MLIIPLTILICSILFLITAFLLVNNYIKVLKQKNELEDKKIILNLDIKSKVDAELDSYIDSAFIEYITLTPKFIDKKIEHKYITKEDEAEILKNVSERVLSQLSNTFIYKMGQVYNINLKLDNNTSLLTDLIMKKVYLLELNYTIEMNKIKSNDTTTVFKK